MLEYATAASPSLSTAEIQRLLDRWLPGQIGDAACPICHSGNIVTKQYPEDRTPEMQLFCPACNRFGKRIPIGHSQPWQGWSATTS